MGCGLWTPISEYYDNNKKMKLHFVLDHLIRSHIINVDIMYSKCASYLWMEYASLR